MTILLIGLWSKNIFVHQMRFPESTVQKIGSRGFTLIEIILVLVILGVIAGLTVPRIGQNFIELQLKRTANDLSYLMRYAQSRAITKNRMVRLEFDDNFSKVWLTQSTEEASPEEDNKSFERITGRLGRTLTVPDKIYLEAETVPVQFYPDGSMDRVRLYVCHEKDCLTVSTQEQRGAVRVFDYKLAS